MRWRWRWHRVTRYGVSKPMKHWTACIVLIRRFHPTRDWRRIRYVIWPLRVRTVPVCVEPVNNWRLYHPNFPPYARLLPSFPIPLYRMPKGVDHLSVRPTVQFHQCRTEARTYFRGTIRRACNWRPCLRTDKKVIGQGHVRSVNFWIVGALLYRCPHRVRRNALMAVVCLSVCPSPCPVCDHNSRTERHRKLKIGRNEAHDTGDPWPHLEVERPKVKVTRPLSAVAENQPYLRNGKAYIRTSLFVYGWSTMSHITTYL